MMTKDGTTTVGERIMDRRRRAADRLIMALHRRHIPGFVVRCAYAAGDTTGFDVGVLNEQGAICRYLMVDVAGNWEEFDVEEAIGKLMVQA